MLQSSNCSNMYLKLGFNAIKQVKYITDVFAWFRTYRGELRCLCSAFLATILKCTSIKKHVSEPATCLLSSLSLVAPSDRPLSSSSVLVVSSSVGRLQVGSDTSSPVLLLSRWQSLSAGSLLAWSQGGQSHAPLALRIASSPHPPTLPARLLWCPQPPTCAVLIRKGWKSEDNGLCVALSPPRKRDVYSTSCPLFISHLCYLFPSSDRPSVSTCPVTCPSACHGKTLMWAFFVPVGVIREGTMRVEGGASVVPCVGLQIPCCFGTPPPPIFLHSSRLHLLLSHGRQLNKVVWVCHPFFFIIRSLIKLVALGRFFLFVSVWQTEDTATQNTSPLTISSLTSPSFIFSSPSFLKRASLPKLPVSIKASSLGSWLRQEGGVQEGTPRTLSRSNCVEDA